MIDRRMILIVVSGMIASVNLSTVRAQRPDPNSPRYKGVVALSDFLGSDGQEALKQFVNEKVSKELLGSLGQDRVSSELNELRSKFAGVRRSGARPDGPFAAHIVFSNGESISFEMEANPPHRFVRIGSIGDGESPGRSAGHAKPQQESTVSSFAQLDEMLEAEADAETFSGVVLVAKDGVPIVHEAYGYADKKAGVRNRRNTKFNLGSLNKLFTMVAVYQLLEAGKLSLDDTIGKFLPQFPPAVADSVTVKHLLDHRSGWAAYWDNPTWNARRAELRSLDDYMEFIKDIPLDFEPGSRKQYSNTGYEVLGAIVQKASGQSYFDYVRDHVYTPIGMMDTDAYDREGDTPNMAIGYVGGGYAEDNLSMLSPKGTAAGGGMSTAADMMKFAEALYKGIVIPNQCAKRLRRGRFAGGGPGVNAELHLNVAGGHTIIVLSNFDPRMDGRIAREVTGILSNNDAAATGANRYRIGVGLEPNDDGITVSFLEQNGPGEKGGLHPGDVILALNGVPIADDPIDQLDALLTKPDPLKMKIRREGELIVVTVRPEPVDEADKQASLPGKVPCQPGCAPPTGSAVAQSNGERLLGVRTDTPDAKTVAAMNLTRRIRTEGRVVIGTRSGSPADRAGIRTGDVLVQLGDNRLYSRDGLNDFLLTTKPGIVPVRYKRKGTSAELTTEISLSSNDLPQPDAGIRWEYAGMGQLEKALAAAKTQGKRLLVGLSGSETCCAFSRFESPAIAAALAGEEIAQLAARYVTLIIRRPHAYWFLEQISDVGEDAKILALPSGLKLPNGEVLPIPSVFVLDAERKVIDRVALADGSAASTLPRMLARHSGK